VARGWVWAGAKARHNGGEKHGFPCRSGRYLQAMCDMEVASPDARVPSMCPDCDVGPMGVEARYFCLHSKAPGREIITLDDARIAMWLREPLWMPSLPRSPEREREMEEISKLMK